jgi:hypothetical protein
MTERDCAGVRHFPANALWSFAKSFIWITQRITFCSPAASAVAQVTSLVSSSSPRDK